MNNDFILNRLKISPYSPCNKVLKFGLESSGYRLFIKNFLRSIKNYCLLKLARLLILLSVIKNVVTLK